MKYLKTGLLILFLMIPILIIITKNQTIAIKYQGCDNYYYDNKLISKTATLNQQLNKVWITKDNTLLENIILIPGQEYKILENGIEVFPNNEFYEYDTSNLTQTRDQNHVSDWYINYQNQKYTKYLPNEILGSLSTCKENND